MLNMEDYNDNDKVIHISYLRVLGSNSTTFTIEGSFHAIRF